MNISGKYIHEKTRTQYLELKPDGSYFLFEGFAGVTGTYEVHGAEITLSTGESSSQAEIHDDVITDSEGDRWVRAKAAGETSTSILKCPECNTDLSADAKFCSNCGAVLGASARAPRRVTTQPAGDERLASVPWLAELVRKNLPWELFEAIAWVAVLILLFVA